MATKYVSNSTYGGRPIGDDANEGSAANPWLTIQKAVETAASGDTIKINQGTYNETKYNYLRLIQSGGVTLTLEPWGTGDIVTLDTSHASYAIRADVFGTYTFKQIDVKTDSPTFLIYCDADTDYNLTFDNCDFDTLTSTDHYFIYTDTHTSAPEGSVVFKNNCTFTSNSSAYQAFNLYDVKTFRVVDSTMTRTNVSGSNRVFLLRGKIGSFDVQRNTIITDDLVITDCTALGVADYVEKLRLNKNAITGGNRLVYIDNEDVQMVEIDGNTGSSSYNATKFSIGPDNGPITRNNECVRISNNKMTFTGATGHVMLLGTSCYGALIYNNDFERTVSGDYGIVIKGRHNNVFNNRIKSGNPIYIAGGRYNTVWNNTAIAISGYAFHWNREVTDGTTAICNEVFNNVFDGSAGGEYAVYDLTPGGNHGDNRFDYNVLIAGSTDLARLDGVNYSTIAAMQAKWATWSEFWPDNDKHSFEGRAVKKMGRPDMYGNQSHVGAVLPRSSQYRGRYKISEG